MGGGGVVFGEDEFVVGVGVEVKVALVGEVGELIVGGLLVADGVGGEGKTVFDFGGFEVEAALGNVFDDVTGGGFFVEEV